MHSCRGKSDSGTTGSTSSDLSKMDRVVIENKPDFPVDSCFAKIEYVKLGNTGDVLIGQVTHLLFTPDHIIVGDNQNANAVFVFDRKGNARTVINRFGRGPQEYLSINDVFLTPDKKTIGITDRAGQKLLYFDLDGRFKWKTSLPFSFYCSKTGWGPHQQLSRFRIVSRQGRFVVHYRYHCTEYPWQHFRQSVRCAHIPPPAFGCKAIRRPDLCMQGFRRHDLSGDQRKHLPPLLA